MEVIFVNPSPELAAYQRARSLEYMARALRASKADVESPRSVSMTLAKAKFDPFLIALLGGRAAQLAKSARKRSGSLVNCIVAASILVAETAILDPAVSAALDVIC